MNNKVQQRTIEETGPSREVSAEADIHIITLQIATCHAPMFSGHTPQLTMPLVLAHMALVHLEIFGLGITTFTHTNPHLIRTPTVSLLFKAVHHLILKTPIIQTTDGTYLLGSTRPHT